MHTLSSSPLHLIIPALIILFLTSSIAAQQSYARSSCLPNITTGSGYSCNGLNNTCQTYLIYRAQPPYNTVSSIASLLSADSSQTSKINNISDPTAKLATLQELIVPFNCSCTGQYYQKNTTFDVVAGDTHYLISKNTYEGLTTCKAIQDQRTGLAQKIYPGEKLTIPIRCACPTKNQTDLGIKYLMTYTIKSGDAIAIISNRFDTDVGMTLQANEKSEEEPTIYPFTTLLVPLQQPPNVSQTVTPAPSPESSPPPVTSPTNKSPPSTGSSNKKWTYFGEGFAAGGAVVGVLAAMLFFLLIKNKSKNEEESEPIVVSSQSFEAQVKPEKDVIRFTDKDDSLDFLDSISSIAQSLKVYSFIDLQSATDDFSSTSWIKGSVYKGRINGEQVAIKKTDMDVTREIDLLNKFNHINIIRLLGICFYDSQWYLVYEYAANGPLDEWLHEESDYKILNWRQRLQIGLDTATGIEYLHSYTTPPIVHKDITSSNVLLDRDFRAKITNLRLSRSMGGQSQHTQFTTTEHIVGTKGYLAPEYLENGLITPKLDVYAFGVFLLEMITGKNVHHLYEKVTVSLSELLAPVLREGEDAKGTTTAFIDQSLQENYPTEIVISLVKLIDKCLKKDPGSRPSMDEIVRFLSKAVTTSLTWDSTTASLCTTKQ